jgi:hypothetical protein
VSATGRPEREHRAQREGQPSSATGRPEREHRSAQREGGGTIRRGSALPAIAAVALALAALPFAGLPAFYESFLYLVFHWIVLATSWNILSGYS